MNSGFDASSANAGRPDLPLAARLTQWRNWNLPVKFLAVVLIPVTLAIALGALRIHERVGQAQQYAFQGHMINTASSLRTVVNKLQHERDEATTRLVNGPIVDQEVLRGFAESDGEVRSSLPILRAHATEDPVVRRAVGEVDRRLGPLPALRDRVVHADITPAEAISSYSRIIDSLLATDRALLGQLSATKLTATASAAHELAKVGEQTHLRHALLKVAVARDEFTPTTLARLSETETRRAAAADEFRASASPAERSAYEALPSIPGTTAQQRGLRMVANQAPTGPPVASEVSRTALGGLQSRINTELSTTATALQSRSSNLAGVEAVVLLCTLMAAGAVVVVVARQLLGSLAVLHRGALMTANEHLPRAVADIRAGRERSAALDPVPVDTTEEVGQLARAFDDVHARAVQLAVEQTTLRRGYDDTFVTVSRRSQSLLDRQLLLFEQLERDEQDPDQLAMLFQLDHLSTRMRRNNENLVVLSGSNLTRRFTQPALPGDLVRAAISEIEHYPRVAVHPLPNIAVVGNAASDLVRLLAELIDNAANFSAPETTVTVSAQQHGDGPLDIDIVDRGVGMDDVHLTEVNEQLQAGSGDEPSTSARTGLLIVGRLARLLDIDVALSRGWGGAGTRATVRVRNELLLPGPRHALSTEDGGTGGHVHSAMLAGDTERIVPVRGVTVRDGDQSPQFADESPDLDLTATRDLLRDPVAANRDDLDEAHTVPTPIFDAMASAWFQLPGEDTEEFPGQGERDEPAAAASTGSNWSFSSDPDRHHAEHVSSAEPEDYTTAGLPLRIPRAKLVAGSARATNGASEATARRNPDTARNRLTSFQEGLMRGRHRSTAADDSVDTADDWDLQPDETAQHAAAVLNEEPVEHTSRGLPLRTPLARLVPGSANTSDDAEAEQPLDAEEVRGRLSRFQDGIRQGKHSLQEPAEVPSEPQR